MRLKMVDCICGKYVNFMFQIFEYANVKPEITFVTELIKLIALQIGCKPIR